MTWGNSDFGSVNVPTEKKERDFRPNAFVRCSVETPFEKRIVTLIYKRKFSKVPFEKADAPLRKSFSESLF